MTVEVDKRNERRAAERNRRVHNQRADTPSDFVNYELDKEQAKLCAVWRNDIETVVNLWTELVEGGYRVNTKYDDYSSSCAAFIIPPTGDDNDGYILTGRGGDAYRALANALYKHVECCKGVWSVLVTSRRAGDDPDF